MFKGEKKVMKVLAFDLEIDCSNFRCQLMDKRELLHIETVDEKVI